MVAGALGHLPTMSRSRQRNAFPLTQWLFGFQISFMASRHHLGWTAVVRLLVCAICLTPACSSLKTYENDSNKNLQVRTQTESESWLPRVRTSVDIHRVWEGCTVDYQGTVRLSQPKTDIGIPPDQWSYLVFVFSNSTLLADRNSTTTYETLVKPRPNYRYEAEVSYKNDLYHVSIREIPPNRSAGRELDRVALNDCRSLSVRK